MKEVWKFPITLTAYQEISMPAGAEVLHINVQQGQPCMWVQVYPYAPKVVRRFGVFGTGHELRPTLKKYCGTYMQDNGTYVWHVYELN